jgi:hypothetical protein
MNEFDRAANNILQNLDESFIINENFINTLKQKFGEFTTDTLTPFVQKALQKLKQEDPQLYAQIGTAVQNNDIGSLQQITQGAGDIQQEGILKGLGTMAKGGWEAAKGIDKLLAKKLSAGKRGLLYILFIAITLMAVTGEKPVEYEGFKDIEIEQVVQDQGAHNQHIIDFKAGETYDQIMQDIKSGKISKKEGIQNLAKAKGAVRGVKPSQWGK